MTTGHDACEFRPGTPDDGVQQVAHGRRFDLGQSAFRFTRGDAIEQALIADRLTRFEVLIEGHHTSIGGPGQPGKPWRRNEMLSMRCSPGRMATRCGHCNQTGTRHTSRTRHDPRSWLRDPGNRALLLYPWVPFEALVRPNSCAPAVSRRDHRANGASIDTPIGGITGGAVVRCGGPFVVAARARRREVSVRLRKRSASRPAVGTVVVVHIVGASSGCRERVSHRGNRRPICLVYPIYTQHDP